MKPARTSATHPPDPTVYPAEDDVGEEIIQRWICELLRPLLDRFLRERGERAFVGADQFVYWRQHDPRCCVSPDVYVMPGVEPDAPVKIWKVWEDRVVPSFALEVVSEDRRKDYERSPERHGELGTSELVIFDPHSREGRDRVRWQVYRQLPKRGFAQVARTDADRVRSRSLRCFLRETGQGPTTRIRIATGSRGETLYATDAERAEHEHARAEAAEAELARVRAELIRERRSR